MKCDKCNCEFAEKEIDESHDVPCYLFYEEIGRNNKKNKADKYGRHYLCKDCHKKYDEGLNIVLIQAALNFSKEFFKEVEDGRHIC